MNEMEPARTLPRGAAFPRGLAPVMAFALAPVPALALVLTLTPGFVADEPIRATFIGNSAFHLTDGTVAVLTDFPYRSGAFGYMTWSSADVPTGPSPLCIISHAHDDHFDAGLAAEFCGAVLGPEDATGDAAVTTIALEPVVHWEGITVRALRTPHASVEHYSFLLEWDGRRFFFTGDTEDPAELLAARDLDVAFVTPWLLDSVRRTNRRIDAGRIVVYHHRADEAVADASGEVLIPDQGDTLTMESP